MRVLNFAHPLTVEQSRTIEQLAGRMIEHVEPVPCQLDNAKPFEDQLAYLVDRINLTVEQWQTKPMLIVPPSYAPAASTLLAILHGRMGYFPTVVRIRPIANSLPPQFEVAELIQLNNVRDAARQGRFSS